uniref:CAP10 domain-containing protein n=2 Tax=Macrostomum lignano TaxID=282301 RepID=A0A1I8HC55_9PLAT
LFERAIVRVPEDRQRLRETLGNFTEQPHGRRFRRLFQEKLRRLRWPYEAANDKLTVTGQDGSAYHYLLPSFLNLVQALEASGREFCIVIRTFGRDAPHILNALDMLAKGQHPGYPRRLDMKVNLEPERFQRLAADKFRYLRSDGVELTQERQVYEHWSSSCGAMAVVDDFAFWQVNNYSSSASKLLWFDPRDTRIQHIIFDDNIRVFDEDSIVHFRSFETATDEGTDCPPERLQSLENALFVTADLLESSSDANYFIDRVLQCEVNYDRLCSEFPAVDS